jgi:hypothetical protein
MVRSSRSDTCVAVLLKPYHLKYGICEGGQETGHVRSQHSTHGSFTGPMLLLHVLLKDQQYLFAGGLAGM